MSVQAHGDGWKVRWRENGRQPSRYFTRKTDAVLFDSEVKRRQQLGPHLVRELDRTGVTLHDFLADGFEAHAATLAPKTRRHYRWVIGHLGDLLDEPLVTLGVPRLAAHQQRMIDGGASANTVRVVMVGLSGILTAAVDHGVIVANPVRGLRRVPAKAKEDVRPLSPVQLETLLAAFTGRAQVIVALGGHLGLRPQEARKALWSDFDGSTLTISRARTKSTAARTRIIEVPAATRAILRAWQLQSGGRDDQPILGALNEDALRTWADRCLGTTARRVLGRRAGRGVTLYTLRHTHASTLHYCGWTVPDAAARMGHSPVVHMEVYAHPIQQIGSQRWRDLDDLIGEARQGLEDAAAAADA